LNLPKLRFKGFKDEWKSEELSSLVTYTKGFAFKSLDYKNTGYRIIRVSDLLKESINKTNNKIYIDKSQAEAFRKYQLQPGEIIVTTVGSKPELINSAVGRTIYYNSSEKEFLNQNLIKLNIKDGLNSYFIYQNTKKERYMNHIDNIQRGNANQSNITVKELLEYKVSIPTLEEQSKVAYFFEALDNKIQLQQEKINLLEEQKKGYMQKIFKQKIRFKDENGEEYSEWKTLFVSDILNQHLREIEKPNQPYTRLGIRSHAKGTFHELVKNPKDVSMDKLYVVRAGDFIINITFAWEQALAIADKLDDGKLVSHRFPTYRFKDGHYSGFYKYYFTTKYFKYCLGNASPGGAGRNRVLNKKDFMKINISVPQYEEQLKIANFLFEFDEKIQIEQQKLEALQEQKKGFMQQMFI